MSERQPIEVAELRERLRALGYLNAGVDRFVLAPSARERGPMGLAWRVSLRIGLLAALLLGPAAALGVFSRLPGLIAGARDAVVVAAYLALIFGAGAALMSLAAAIAVRLAARGASAGAARRGAIAAGALVGIACLVYLTLWWNAASLGAAWAAPARTLAALAAAVGISVLLGHAITIAALALVAREQVTLPAPAMSWRASIAVAGVAFVGASGMLALSASAAAAPPLPEFAVVPTGVRVVVIGIDGFDPALYEKWAGSATAPPTPILDRLSACDDFDQDHSDPASTWTSIGTGVPSGQHGVSGFQSWRVLGLQGTIAASSPLVQALSGATDLVRLTRPAPVGGLERRHRMMWEVAADKGLNAAVVNWWATWPATHTKAVVLSDRATLRLEAGGQPGAELSPASLYPVLRRRWPDIRERARQLAEALGRDVTDRSSARILIRSAVLDAEQALLAREPALGSPDLLSVYLPGLDIAQHEMLQGRNAPALPPSVLAERLAALPRYHAYLDRLIRETLLEDLPPETVVLVVTHPGRVGGRARCATAISGGPVRSGVRHDARRASLADIAPTVLYLLGLPVSRELTGEPMIQALDPAFVRRYPLRHVETYGRYAADARAAQAAPLDKEMLERLRSLGYIR